MRIRVNGTELYVDIDGSHLRIEKGRLVERPTILALHGGPGFDQGYLRPGLGLLRDDARVVFVDLRGQGRSGRPPLETCTLEQMADDVAALIDQIGLADPVVFGHSAGGFVALHLALSHPELVRGLILCDSAPTLARLPDDAPPPSLADRSSPEAVAIASRLFSGDFSARTLDAFAQWVAPYYSGPAHTDVPNQILPLSGFASEVAERFFRVHAVEYDLRSRLAEISAPTLVLVGSYDWVCPPVASRALAAGIPGADLVEFPEAGHFAFSELPGAFLAAVRAFLEKNLADPARA